MPKIKEEIKRGDLYWAQFDPSVGAEIQKIRPVVVMTLNPFNRARKTFIGVPLSTSATVMPPLNIQLTGGSVARCDQVKVMDKSRLREKMGSISQADMRAISAALIQVMGLDM